MKALMIAPQPFFTPRGTPFSVYYRALVMSEMGIEIDLLTYGEGQDIELSGVTTYRIPRFAKLGQVKIGPSKLKLFLDIILIAWTIKLLVKKKYDLVHAHEEAVIFCRYLKPLFRFRLIYDMHSSLPQQLRNFRFTNSNILINIFKFLEGASLKASDAVITICPDLAEYVENILFDKSKHVLIENSIFEHVRLKPLKNKDEIKEPHEGWVDFINQKKYKEDLIIYTGTLEAYQGIDTLLAAFKKVHEKRPNTMLVIVGGSTRQVQEYQKLSRNIGIDNSVIFTGRVPQFIAQKLSRFAKVQVSPRSTGTNTPLKIYEQLASGIPLVATNIYSHTQALNSEIAFLVNPDPDDMAQGIIEALSDKKLCDQKVSAAKSLYATKYSRPVYENKLRKVLQKTL